MTDDLNKNPNITDEEVSEYGTGEEIESDMEYSDDNLADTVKKLKEKVKLLEKEKMEYLTGWQRTKADHANFVKRTEEDKKEIIKYATERLVDDLIPVLQNFDMAFGNKEAWEKVDKNWRTGVEYIYSHLKQTLEGSGLEEINPLGQDFDLNRDEAMEHVKVSDASQDGKVLEVIQKGYKLNGKIIKPAKVKIGEHKNE